MRASTLIIYRFECKTAIPTNASFEFVGAVNDNPPLRRWAGTENCIVFGCDSDGCMWQYMKLLFV